jgi:hypothetical protein
LTLANGISLSESQKVRDSPGFHPEHVVPRRACPQRAIAKKIGQEIMFQYQLVMSIVGLPPQITDSMRGRRKFGRIYQRFWFARCCGSRLLQSE